MSLAPNPDSTPPGEKTWSVGTLTYTRPQLVNVFLWMLWGDFCLQLMDSGVQPNVIPLQLKKYGASMSAIGFLTGTVVEILSIVGVVLISTWSDRHRGRLGRRMPFMLYATPPLAICLIALGFSPQLAAGLQRTMPMAFGGFALSQLVIAVIAVTMIAYKIFDLFPQSLYYYLFADVIPQEVMGKFVALFRVCSTAGVLFFNYFLLQHAEDNPGLICIIAGVLYLFAFIMLTVTVREGEYPPPPPAHPGSAVERFRETAKRYARDCYSMGFYWKFYIFCFFFMCGVAPFGRFLVFFGKEITGGDLKQLGRINSLRDFVQMGAFFFAGPIIDRLHPIRAALIGLVLMVVTSILSLCLIRTPGTFALWVTITFVTIALAQGAYAALSPRILPRDQYGQFCSANSMLWHFGLMVALPLCGRLLERAGNRYVFAWFAYCAAGALVMLLLVYLDWKKLGGDEGYQPPSPPINSDRGFEVVQTPAK